MASIKKLCAGLIPIGRSLPHPQQIFMNVHADSATVNAQCRQQYVVTPALIIRRDRRFCYG